MSSESLSSESIQTELVWETDMCPECGQEILKTYWGKLECSLWPVDCGDDAYEITLRGYGSQYDMKMLAERILKSEFMPEEMLKEARNAIWNARTAIMVRSMTDTGFEEFIRRLRRMRGDYAP